MAMMKFHVPDDVKAEFDKTFREQNKNAVIADLMRRAAAEERKRKRLDAFLTLTKRRTERPPLSDTRIRNSRTAGRP
jgi:hypothetical protein